MPTSLRLQSLDVLRGFDLFCLTILCPLLHAFSRTGEYAWLTPVMEQFDHKPWAGFAFWDLVMPLFMFMAGVSIPFALSRYRRPDEKNPSLYIRIVKRFIVLWILGMICQGNLLALNPAGFRLYSNTLQAIAIGYLFASLLFLHLRLRGQIAVTAGLLIAYWALMTFVRANGYGGGNYTPSANLAEWVDRLVLGRWRDGASADDAGNITFPAWYNYTWVLSSLNFVATVMTGVLAGQILKKEMPEKKKLTILLAVGCGMVMAGWLWHLQMPVIKRLWTSSMVLVSSGYCFLLMAAFYYIIDVKGFRSGWTWLKVIGMNSILAYMLSVEVGVFNFSCVSHSLLFGLQQYTSPQFYQLIILCANLSLVYVLLYILYKHKIFIKA